MRKSYRLLAGSLRSALAALVFLAGSAGAVPAGFNVQGRLTDSTGVNRNGTFSLKFTLFDSVTAGNNLWSRTFASVGVTNGGFQITLADPDDTNRQLAGTLSAASLFLEIQVLSGPGISAPESPLVPRQQLLSVPFSFAAGGIVSSGPAVVNVGGAEQLRITSQGFVGIGTTNPSNALSVSGNANVNGNISAGSFSGSGGGLSGVPWGGLSGFPGGCPGGQFVTSVGGSLSCASPPAPPSTNGAVVNSAHAESASVTYTNALMNEGDNVPQVTQGTEILNVTITPKSATDKLFIMVAVPYGTYDGKPNTVAALFRDGAGNSALSTSYNFANDSGHTLEHDLRYYTTAGTTSPITFRVRVGIGTSWNGLYLTVNGNGGVRMGGGTSYAYMDVFEIGSQ